MRCLVLAETTGTDQEWPATDGLLYPQCPVPVMALQAMSKTLMAMPTDKEAKAMCTDRMRLAIGRLLYLLLGGCAGSLHEPSAHARR